MNIKSLLYKWREIANKDKQEYSEEDLRLIKLQDKLAKALMEAEFGKDNADKIIVTISWKE